jgi:hypothetical protein
MKNVWFFYLSCVTNNTHQPIIHHRSTWLALIAIVIALLQRPIELLWDRLISATGRTVPWLYRLVQYKIVQFILLCVPLSMAAFITMTSPINKDYIIGMVGMGVSFTMMLTGVLGMADHAQYKRYLERRFREVQEELERVKKATEKNRRNGK